MQATDEQNAPHDGVSTRQCPLCDATFFDVRSLVVHLKDNHRVQRDDMRMALGRANVNIIINTASGDHGDNSPDKVNEMEEKTTSSKPLFFWLLLLHTFPISVLINVCVCVFVFINEGRHRAKQHSAEVRVRDCFRTGKCNGS